MRTIALLLALVLLSGALISVPAVAAPDRREMQAREAYAAGNYQPALGQQRASRHWSPSRQTTPTHRLSPSTKRALG